jgi:hypothetical protein
LVEVSTKIIAKNLIDNNTETNKFWLEVQKIAAMEKNKHLLDRIVAKFETSKNKQN